MGPTGRKNKYEEKSRQRRRMKRTREKRRDTLRVRSQAATSQLDKRSRKIGSPEAKT